LDLLVSKDLLVRLDLVVMLVCRVFPAPRVPLVPKVLADNRAKEETVVNQDPLANSDPQVPMDKLDLLAHAVQPVKTVFPEPTALKDPLDLTAFKAFPANPVLEVSQDPKVNLVLEANQLNLTTCLLKSMLALSLNPRLFYTHK